MQPSKQTAPPQVESTLTLGNRALRDANYATAIEYYLSALQDNPAMAKLLAGNMDIARKKYRVERDKAERQRVAVCGWELSHNSAGRVYTLTQLYQTFADVEIIGSLFAGYGRELWEPIRTTTIPCHTFIVEEESRFLDQALALVAAHPYDIVHLSKPRISNIFIGLLYKLIWGAKVLVDIDDEELAFVGAQTPISIDDYLAANEKLPELKELDGRDWTRIAVGLAKEFDGITVSNHALQQRYGGQLIRHARDEKLYQPSPELKYKSREKFGIPQDKKVVLFFGTPREHKGLLETAKAIAQLERKDLLFVIVGDFTDSKLKDKLLAIPGVDYQFFSNQPFDSIPKVVAMGDICVFLQDPDSPVSQFQVPAKLSDALAMGLVIFLNKSLRSVETNFSDDFIYFNNTDELAFSFKAVLENESLVKEKNTSAISLFQSNFSISINSKSLLSVVCSAISNQEELNIQLTQMIIEGFCPALRELNKLALKNRINKKHLNFISAKTKKENNIRGNVDILIQPSSLDTERIFYKTDKIKTLVGNVADKLNNYFYTSTRYIAMGYNSSDVFLHIIVYSTKPGNDLRLTLESIKNSLVNNKYCIHVVLDWLIEDHNLDYSLVLGNCSVYRFKEKNGLYASVNEIVKKIGASNICIIRQGVVVAPNMFDSLITACVIEGKYEIASPLTNNILGSPIVMKAGENIITTSTMLEHINGAGSSIQSPIVDIGVFLISKSAFSIVPFPAWSWNEDKTDQSLVRYLKVMIERGGRIGILLDCYAINLNNQLENTKESFCNFLELEKQSAYVKELNAFQENIRDKYFIPYQASFPVVNSKKTVCFLLSSLKLVGGVIVLVNLINQMILNGINVRVFIRHLGEGPDKGLRMLFQPESYKTIEQIESRVPVKTIFIATLWITAKEVEALLKKVSGSQGYYFIQDYEVLFYDKNSTDKQELEYYKGSIASYKTNLIKVATSQWIEDQLYKNGLIHNSPIMRIGVGIDHAIYPPTNVRRNLDRTIIIGAMARPSTLRRGFSLLNDSIKAFKEMQPLAKIVYFGTDSLCEFDISYDYELLGIVEPDNLRSVYALIDIFVDTSDFQGFGLCPLESMAFGSACVLVDSGGVNEYAINGKNSLVVKHDVDEIAYAINLLYVNKDLREQLSKEAINTAKHFDISETTIKWLKLFNQFEPLSIKSSSPACVVVIPIYNKIHVARRCIDSVLKTLSGNHELVIIDDCGDDYTASALKNYVLNYSRVTYLRNDINLGFVGASNRGMAFAAKKGKDIILLNSDTIVVPGWIERLYDAALSDEKIGIVSPMSTESSHLYIKIEAGESFISTDKWLNQNIMPHCPAIITPEGWCFFIKNNVYELIGGLDKIFGRGYCEESDYCMRTLVAGFRLAVCENLMVYHQGKVTFGEERSGLYENNRVIFDRRWAAIYQRLYKDFIRVDPLNSIRIKYKQDNSHFESTSDEAEEFHHLLKIFDIPELQSEIIQFERILTSQNSQGMRDSNSIAFVIPDLLPYGGVISIIMLVNSLLLDGYDVKLVVLNDAMYFGDDLGCLTKPIFLRCHNSFLNNFPEVDMVVGTFWLTLYYIARLVVRRPNIKLGYYIQDFEADFYVDKEAEFRDYVLNTYRWPLLSFCKTPWIQEKVRKYGGQIELVLPALPLDIFYPMDSVVEINKPNPILLGMFRPNTPQRGSETLLAVIRLVSKSFPNIEIWTFGSDQLPEAIKAEGLIDKHWGIVNNEKLPNLYSAADIFLETSNFHGFGRTIAEAMACETACVITNSGGVSHFAKDEVNCLMAAPKDINGLAERVIRLLGSEDERVKLGKSGRKTVEKFDPDNSAREILTYLGLKRGNFV